MLIWPTKYLFPMLPLVVHSQIISLYVVPAVIISACLVLKNILSPALTLVPLGIVTLSANVVDKVNLTLVTAACA